MPPSFWSFSYQFYFLPMFWPLKVSRLLPITKQYEVMLWRLKIHFGACPNCIFNPRFPLDKRSWQQSGHRNRPINDMTGWLELTFLHRPSHYYNTPCISTTNMIQTFTNQFTSIMTEVKLDVVGRVLRLLSVLCVNCTNSNLFPFNSL